MFMPTHGQMARLLSYDRSIQCMPMPSRRSEDPPPEQTISSDKWISSEMEGIVRIATIVNVFIRILTQPNTSNKKS
jgi:hypothetical protein